ncbi:MAG: hypothetical protein JRI23_12480 [Deltaproteobacteria bacterium]|jgi:hypothetical protein|nr:hypothetical protein [Deltaproteobacteria bacterium]MBW2532529.1 hypothetical protein [Deltaproteobacteria bacterium]
MAAVVPTNPLPPTAVAADAASAPQRKRTRPNTTTETRAVEVPKEASYLPFKDKGGARPPKLAVKARNDPPIGLGSTVVGEVVSPFAKALPFEQATESVNVPQLTLEQYASFCAERNARPAEQEATLKKYGITDAKAENALDDQWQDAFEAKPNQRERWLQMVREFTAWLENHPSG